MSTASQGHDFRGWYLHEDNGFASSPTDNDPKPFGADATIDQFEGSNQAVQFFQPGSRVPAGIIERLFDGAWQASFTQTNPWWLNFIFGAPSQTDNGDGSYTYTWNGENPQSHQIGLGRTQSGEERVGKGCVLANATVTPQVGGMAQVQLTGAYAKEEIVDPASITSQPGLNQDPFTFADAELRYGGSAIGYVQQGSIQLQNNTELISQLGERTPIDYAPRPLIPTVNFSKINEAGETDNLSKMYGSSSATSIQDNITAVDTMALVLDNAVSAGSGKNTISFDFTGTFPDSYGESGLGDPQADVTEDINRLTETVEVKATLEQSSAR